MPKRELSKCRVWEKERRERLKTCFDALSKLLPSYDPSITPSKLEILQRAASHITDLQQKNKQLLIGDQKSASIVQRDELRRLRDKCRKLSVRSEQLCTLLKNAGIKIPKEYLSRAQNGPAMPQNVFKGPPKLWSGRISKEKAAILKKQNDDIKPTKDPTPKSRKRKRLASPKKSENTPPSKKQNLPLKNSPQSLKKVKKQNFSSENLASKVAPILGPGTLILANGSVVPVPPTTGTLHRIQIVPSVPPNTVQNSIILMSQQNVNNSNKTNNLKSKLPTIRPKNGNGILKNAPPVKVAIPPLPKRKNLAKKLTKNGQKNKLDKNIDLTVKNDESPPENGQKSIPNSSTDSPPKNLPQEGQNLEANLPQNEKETNNDNSEILPDNSSNLEKIKDISVDKNIEDGQNNKPQQNLPENLDEKMAENGQNLENKKNESVDNLGALEPEIPTLKQQNPPNDTNNLLIDPQTGNGTMGGHDEHSLSNDIFATLGGNAGVIGGQHTESMSPTAAFLLAFPLVSTLTGSRGDQPNNLTGGGNLINNNGNNNNNDRNDQTNDDDRQSTPTTLLQIGGNMNSDKNTTLLQIGDTLKNRFSEINENIKKCENYNFYKDFPQNSTPQNMYPQTRHATEDFRVSNNTNQIEKNPENTPQTSSPKEPLISSVLQVSHACLYEQKNINQTGNNFYPYLPEVPQNFPHNNPSNNTPKDKKRQKIQNSRQPVNWMTSPDIRTGYQPNEGGTSGGTSGVTSDYFLPPFSDVYSGISSAITSEIHQNTNNNNADFAWTSGGNRGVLPTLIGDLALGVTVGNTSTPINGGIYTNTNTKSNVTTNNFSYNYEHTNLGGKENSGGFLSVSSMLVEGTKPRKNHQQSGQHKRREKTKHKPENSNFLDQKKYTGGYSAEELIGDTQYIPPNPNIPNYPLNDQFYQHRHQNPPNQPINHQNPPNPQNHQRTNQSYQQRHPTSFPPNHGEFSALLNAAVVDTYSKTFDSFVHVKPPHVPPNSHATSTSYDTSFGSRSDNAPNHRSHQTVTSDSDRRRHRSPRAAPPTSRDPLGSTAANPVPANTTSGFSELSFLSMSGAVSSPILQEEFHSSTPFLNAPPPLPTPVASSLTNFNLSAIFPEINKGSSAPPSSTAAPTWGPTKAPMSSSRQMRYQNQHNSHQNASKNHLSSYVPQQGSTGQSGAHEALYGGPSSAQAFPGILHDGNGAPTNFSFSFGAP